MTPERFTHCLTTIGWSVRGLADKLGVPEVRLRRWGAGRYPVPGDVGRWLERLAAAHERNPAPKVGE